MNILVLLGGDSRAFQEAGFEYPKLLVEVDGIPVIQRVIDALEPLHARGARTTFVLRGEDIHRFHSGRAISLLDPHATIVEIAGETGGAACSALLAVEHIQNDEPLLILNGDSIILADLGKIVSHFEERNLDGGIVVFEAVHPRWSHVRCDAEGNVIETAEKKPISKLATAGVYYFRKGEDFVDAAMKMIVKEASVEGKFFVCPAYNELILRQQKIGVYKINREDYISFSSPQGVAAFEDYLRGQKPRHSSPVAA